MKIGYIKQFTNEEELLSEKQKRYISFFKSTIAKVKKILVIPNVIELDDCVVIILPITDNSKLTENKIRKITKKITKKTYIQNVAISDDLLKNTELREHLEKCKVHILDGKWLWSYMLPHILEYVAKMKQEDIQTQEVSIFVKENSEINIQNVVELAERVKLLNVITNKTERFKNIENYLYYTYGIIIRVTTNKKALSKSKIIINLDFSENELNSFSIPEKAIIINKNKNVDISSKKFSGINIKGFDINFENQNINVLKEYNIYNHFNKNIIYESLIYRNDSYKNIQRQIEKDNVNIKRTYWK